MVKIDFLTVFVLTCGLYITFIFSWKLAVTFIIILIWDRLCNIAKEITPFAHGENK